MLTTNLTWYRPAEQLPKNHACVLGAMSGTYQDGSPFRVVLPMFFFEQFPDDATGSVFENCFVDDDGILRFPIPTDGYETIDYWMNLPPYPTDD